MINRPEERQALNVIPMRVREEQRQLSGWFLNSASNDWPSARNPVPASRMIIWLPLRISTQEVLPP